MLVEVTRLAVIALMVGGALTACASGNDAGASSQGSAATSTARSTSCPTTPPGVGTPPAAGDATAATMPKPVVASTVKPSDTSTSIVISPTGPQIQCGAAAVQTRHDVVFSKPDGHTELTMDVLSPRAGGPRPLVVYLSGGGFLMVTKEAALDQRTYLAEAGYVVASIQYRTVTSGSTYRDSVADVKAAIRFLRTHATEYGIAPDKVGVWGQSAGGYLAAMTGVTNGHREFETGDNLAQSSSVDAVVDEFGPSDLATIASDFDAAAQQAYAEPDNSTAAFLYGPHSGKSVGADPRAVAAANPATYARAGDPAFLFFHGSDDHLVSPSQTLLVHTALRAAGADSTRYVVDGANHGDMTVMGADPKTALPWTTTQVVGGIVTFFGNHLTP